MLKSKFQTVRKKMIPKIKNYITLIYRMNIKKGFISTYRHKNDLVIKKRKDKTGKNHGVCMENSYGL